MSINDNTSNEKIVKTGFLLKRSKYLGKWKKRFIVLTDNYILAYTNDQRGAECTMNLTIKDSFGPKHFDTGNDNEYGFSFANEGKVYSFKTDKKNIKDEWFNLLRETLSR